MALVSGRSSTVAATPTRSRSAQLVVSGALSQSIYYAKNIRSAPARSNVVSVAFSNSPTSPDIRILEYSGADANNPLDGVAGNTGNGAFSSAGTVFAGASDLIFGANTVRTLTAGPGAGFTSRILTSIGGDIAEDETVNASGAYSASAPLTSAGPWVMQMVAFRPTGLGGGSLPPSPPGNLTTTPVSGSQINLSWSASSSSVGIASYLVQRCQGLGCTNFAQIAAISGLIYNDTGLSPNTSYSYQVLALDNAGNSSQPSNIGTATTQAPATVTLSGISVKSSTVTAGNAVNATVSLSGPAGASGATISLATSNPAVAAIPSTVTVAPGATSATFSIATFRVKTTTSVLLSASYLGVSKSLTLTVKNHH